MITKDMFDQAIENFHLLKVTSVKPDADSNESKQVTLKVNFKNVTINQLAQACLGQGVVVKWQNGGGGRKNYDKLVNNQTVNIDFKAPGVTPQVDPLTAIISAAQAEGMSVEDYMKRELEKRSGGQVTTKLRKAE